MGAELQKAALKPPSKNCCMLCRCVLQFPAQVTQSITNPNTQCCNSQPGCWGSAGFDCCNTFCTKSKSLAPRSTEPWMNFSPQPTGVGQASGKLPGWSQGCTRSGFLLAQQVKGNTSTVLKNHFPGSQTLSLVFWVPADDLGTLELLCCRFIGWTVSKSIGSR